MFVSLLRAAKGDSAEPPIKSETPTVDTGSELAFRGQPRLEKRRWQRYPACEIIEVRVIGASGGRFGGMLLDISRWGLKIEIGKPLSQGAHLEILLPSRAIIIGEARYCRSKNKLYHVGVKIENVYFSQAVSSRHIGKELLARYSRDRELSPLDAMEIRAHLAACETCREALAKYGEALLHGMGGPLAE
jgi:Putative zinc-finger/PilZ domain